MLTRALVLALMLALSASTATAQEPKIGKPRPAPATPPNILPLPPASIDNGLAVGGEDVKARKVESRLSVDVMLNGRGPFKFIVDSGADTSAVGVNIARNLQLPLTTPVIVNGMTGRDLVARVKVDRLTVGPSTLGDLSLPALKENDLGGDGMIGIDALVQQRLMMDFETKVIKVEDARIPERRYSADEIVIIARRQRGQLILTHVKAAGLPLDAVIDTGSEITIGNVALRDKLIRRNRDKFIDVPVTGVTGQIAHLQLAVIGELQLGPVILHDVPMAFADVPPFKMFGISSEPALLLGTDILENFRRISLDFRARKVRFQLRKCSQYISLSTSPDTATRLSTPISEACTR